MNLQTQIEGNDVCPPDRWQVVPSPELPAGKIYRPSIGLIELSTEVVMQAEMRAFVPSFAPGIYTSRVSFSDEPSVDGLAEMEKGLTASAGLLPDGEWMDAIVYGCTSGSVVIGPDRVEELIKAKHPQVPVFTPINSVLAGLRAMAKKRIAIVTPYPQEVNKVVYDYITANGVDVVSAATFAFDSGYAMSRIPPRALLAAALDAESDGAEAIFICCTTLQVSAIIEELERLTGKPVISSNQALTWQCYLAAGIFSPPGRGALFQYDLTGKAGTEV